MKRVPQLHRDLDTHNSNTDSVLDHTTDRDTLCSSLGRVAPPAASRTELSRQANKRILIETVGDDLDVPFASAARVLNSVLGAIESLMRDRSKVAVKGFGTFERRVRRGRVYKHPRSGESIEIADKETIVFKPSAGMIDRICNSTVPQSQPNSVGSRSDSQRVQA